MNKPVILVVEDSEIQRKVIKLLADEYDMEVVTAATSAEACEAFQIANEIYNLILMDIGLPDMDGIQCAARLRQLQKGTARTPIVAMTGFVSVNDKERCKQLGFDDCLIKPFSAYEFKTMVQRWTVADYNVLQFPGTNQSEETI